MKLALAQVLAVLAFSLANATPIAPSALAERDADPEPRDKADLSHHKRSDSSGGDDNDVVSGNHVVQWKKRELNSIDDLLKRDRSWATRDHHLAAVESRGDNHATDLDGQEHWKKDPAYVSSQRPPWEQRGDDDLSDGHSDKRHLLWGRDKRHLLWGRDNLADRHWDDVRWKKREAITPILRREAITPILRREAITPILRDNLNKPNRFWERDHLSESHSDKRHLLWGRDRFWDHDDLSESHSDKRHLLWGRENLADGHWDGVRGNKREAITPIRNRFWDCDDLADCHGDEAILASGVDNDLESRADDDHLEQLSGYKREAISAPGGDNDPEADNDDEVPVETRGDDNLDSRYWYKYKRGGNSLDSRYWYKYKRADSDLLSYLFRRAEDQIADLHGDEWKFALPPNYRPTHDIIPEEDLQKRGDDDLIDLQGWDITLDNNNVDVLNGRGGDDDLIDLQEWDFTLENNLEVLNGRDWLVKRQNEGSVGSALGDLDIELLKDLGLRRKRQNQDPCRPRIGSTDPSCIPECNGPGARYPRSAS